MIVGYAEGLYFKALILKYTFDGCIFAIGCEFCLEDYSERAIAHYLTLGVLHFSSLPSDAILDLLPYNLCMLCQSMYQQQLQECTYRPCEGC